MTTSEMLAVTKIYSIAGTLPSDRPLIRHRPFRHSATTSLRSLLLASNVFCRFAACAGRLTALSPLSSSCTLRASLII
jgi:hypothetical protein